MTLYPPLRQGIVYALTQIFFEQAYADKLVPQLLKENKKWGSRDRRNVAEAVYDISRYWRLIWHLLDLEICAENIPQALDYYLSNKDQILQTREANDSLAPLEPCLRESFPEWWLNYLPADKAADILRWLNLPAFPCLRLRGNQSNKTSAIEFLRKEQIPFDVLAENSILLKGKYPIDSWEIYKKGLVEIQDYGSQQIAAFLNPSKGSKIIDACAGAGGKSLHLADLIGPSGKIIALDIYDWKLKELVRRAERAKISNISTEAINDSRLIKKHQEWADFLLLDVPCSGTGVVRRKVDTKWKLTEARLSELIVLQKDLLNRYSGMLRAGGIMVYATCSVFEIENQLQITNFLDSHPNFELLGDQLILPSAQNDGFYMARLRKH